MRNFGSKEASQQMLVGYIVLSLVVLIVTSIYISLLKQEKEEAKEFLDLKIAKQKVSIHNILNDLILSIFIFGCVLLFKKYMGTLKTLLMLSPSILVIIMTCVKRKLCEYYSLKKSLVVIFFLGGMIAGYITKTGIKENISLYGLCAYIIIALTFVTLKPIGVFAGAIIALMLGGTQKEQFYLFVAVLLVGYLYVQLKNFLYPCLFFIGNAFPLTNNYFYIILLLFVCSIIIYLITSRKRVVEKERIRTLDVKKEKDKEDTEDLINFDVNEEDSTVTFDVNETQLDDIFNNTEIKDDWYT